MKIDLTIKNYRCFPDSRPARIPVKHGLTAFVGTNNSGKSSLLKFIYEFRSLFQRVKKENPNTILLALRGQQQPFNHAGGIRNPVDIFCNMNERELAFSIHFTPDKTEKATVPPPREVAFIIPRVASRSFTARVIVDSGALPIADIDLNGTILRHRGVPKADLLPLYEICDALQRSLYIGPFRNAINIGTNANYYDIEVGQSFVKTWREFKTGNKPQDNESALRLTSDIRELFDFSQLDINPSPDDQTMQITVNNKSYQLGDLGSGLTQFILVFAHAAIKKPTFILIDEPELNLHPTLQADFLTALASYAGNGVLYCTHSLGLARTTADRIFTTRQYADGDCGVAPLEATPRLTEFMGEMSFSGYREVGFEKLLLVEGIKDLKTVQEFLRRFKASHRIMLLPLGGSSLINGSQNTEMQIEELKRMNVEIAAMIDSEKSNETEPLERERAKFVEICRKAGVNCHVLEWRATENYLTDRAVKKVKGAKYRALGRFEKREDCSPIWSKEENWRIAREMTDEEVIKSDIGRFLSKVVS